MLFRQIFDPKLAQYAYLIGCQKTKQALLIDPERDIDQYIKLAEEEDVEIVAVAETHIHADFLSGAREFAERHGVKLYLSDEGVSEGWGSEWAKSGDYDVTFLKDGDTFKVGNIEILAIHTPGHTPEHLTFKVTDFGGGADRAMGLVTGDFVFVGDLGRPDLLESAAKMKDQMKPSAKRLFKSVSRFLDFEDYLQVWPGHGAGSACGKALGSVPQTTVGYERAFNKTISAAQEGEDAFVQSILDGQPEPPLYFARMKQLNRDGVPLLGELPRPRHMEADAVAELAQSGDAVVIDARENRSAFMAKHLPGSLFVPLDRQFNTVVGSFVEDPDEHIYLIVEEGRVEEAVRDLIRIGYDHVKGFITPAELERYFQSGGASASIEEIDFEDVERRRGEAQVVDVRRLDEFSAGHVPGAIHAVHVRLPEKLDKLPRERQLLVHCATGVRSAVASAFLAREGFDVAYVHDTFSKYRESAPAEAGA